MEGSNNKRNIKKSCTDTKRYILLILLIYDINFYNLLILAGLGEFRLRDLNDEINKLLREKKHWEYQIRELGGPDFLRMGPRMLDHEGREVPGNRGYKYFGAAKDLPGVRELFEHEPPPPPRRTRAELMKNIDADYYGYMDEEDGLLLAMETKKEKLSMFRTISLKIN